MYIEGELVMKAIMLVAGYATRLYPLTLNVPKALLPVGDKAILDYIVDEVVTIPEIDEIVVISNHKFYEHFVEWKNAKDIGVKITVLDDNTTDDSNKLGAIGDMNFAIETCGIDDDIIVLAGDNLFNYKLKDGYDYFKNVDKDVIFTKEIDSIDDLRRMANVELDENGKVLSLVEKPQNPKSNIAAFATYIYKKETLPIIKKYLDEGNNPDAPGFFPAYLHKIKDVYAYKFEGECIDIGTPESYKNVCENIDKFF